MEGLRTLSKFAHVNGYQVRWFIELRQFSKLDIRGCLNTDAWTSDLSDATKAIAQSWIRISSLPDFLEHVP